MNEAVHQARENIRRAEKVLKNSRRHLNKLEELAMWIIKLEIARELVDGLGRVKFIEADIIELFVHVAKRVDQSIFSVEKVIDGAFNMNLDYEQSRILRIMKHGIKDSINMNLDYEQSRILRIMKHGIKDSIAKLSDYAAELERRKKSHE